MLLVVTAPASGAMDASEMGASESEEGGLLLPSGPWVAGDVTARTTVPQHGPAVFEVDDASLLARWEPGARLALFTELRLEDLVKVVEGEGTSTGSADVVLERAYAEVLVTASLTARLGKVFTPFGLWNVIRRAPLTWTVERPAATEEMFPEHATGLSLTHQTTWRGWSLDATTYGPIQDEVAFRHSEERGWLVGGRVAAGRGVGTFFGSIGLNAAAFRGWDESPWTTATGVDAELGIAGHQITGELTFRIPGDGGRTTHGLYVQDVIPLAPLGALARDLYGVLRLEYFQPRRGGAAVGQLLGLFWRPLPRLVLRADYLFSTRTLERLDPGFFGSVSVLL